MNSILNLTFLVYSRINQWVLGINKKYGFLLTISLLHLGCLSITSQNDISSEALESSTPRPQALVYLNEDLLAVSDVAYHGGIWGEGRVFILNTQTQEIVREIIQESLEKCLVSGSMEGRAKVNLAVVGSVEAKMVCDFEEKLD